MPKIINVKPSEVSKIFDMSNSSVSQLLRRRLTTEDMDLSNSRILGVRPSGVEKLLTDKIPDFYNKSSMILVAANCGGVSKTYTSTTLFSICARFTEKKIKIFVDLDPQHSATQFFYGSPTDDEEPVLIDYVAKRVDFKDILNKVDGFSNAYCIKGSLNNLYLDKAIQDPKTIKDTASRFFKDMFDHFSTKDIIVIFDSPPAISNFAASVIVSCQKYFDNSIIVSPIRSSDRWSIAGAKVAINNVKEILEVYSIPDEIKKVVFLSHFDQRKGSSSIETLRNVAIDPVLGQYLHSSMIRYSTFVAKAINDSQFENIDTSVFSTLQSLKTIGSDFISLFLEIFGKRD